MNSVLKFHKQPLHISSSKDLMALSLLVLHEAAIVLHLDLTCGSNNQLTPKKYASHQYR